MQTKLYKMYYDRSVKEARKKFMEFLENTKMVTYPEYMKAVEISNQETLIQDKGAALEIIKAFQTNGRTDLNHFQTIKKY